MNRRLYIAGPVVALVVVVIGATLVAWAESQTVSLGWFAYAPLSGTTFRPTTGLLGAGIVAGVALTAVGLTGLGFWAGARPALRRRPVVSAGAALVALLFVVVGVTLVAVSQLSPLSFPASDSFVVFGQGFVGDPGWTEPARLVGVGATLVTLGMVAFAFWSGRRVHSLRRNE